MSADSMRQKRLRRVLGYALLFVAVGNGYAVFIQKTGLAVPCVFHLMTGLSCPGCGVTRMCVALLQFDFAKAYYSNQAIFLLMPVLGIVFLKYLVDYVKTGRWQMNRIQTGVLYVSVAALVIFGFARNILPL